MTAYSNRSNAARAAKKAGLEKFSIIAVGDKFSFEDATPVAVKPAKKAAARKAPARKVPAPTGESKKARLIEMCSRGATIAELTETFGWLPHTVRGLLSRIGKEGYTITRTGSGAESFYTAR